MSKKKKSKYSKFVNHPLYGDSPNYTNDNIPLDAVLSAHWQYKEEEVIPGTALKADTAKQNYGMCSRSLYVDLMRKCRQCERMYIFYAREQKYWYEELGFFVDADCVKCIECRKKEREIKSMLKEYEILLHNQNRTEKENLKFKSIALELYQQGYIQNAAKIPKS